MAQRVNHKHDQSDLWVQSQKWPGTIPLEWVHIKDISNYMFGHIENPYNENFWRDGARRRT